MSLPEHCPAQPCRTTPCRNTHSGSAAWLPMQHTTGSHLGVPALLVPNEHERHTVNAAQPTHHGGVIQAAAVAMQLHKLERESTAEHSGRGSERRNGAVYIWCHTGGNAAARPGCTAGAAGCGQWLWTACLPDLPARFLAGQILLLSKAGLPAAARPKPRPKLRALVDAATTQARCWRCCIVNHHVLTCSPCLRC